MLRNGAIIRGTDLLPNIVFHLKYFHMELFYVISKNSLQIHNSKHNVLNKKQSLVSNCGKSNFTFALNLIFNLSGFTL
jgi:hypothetical protein